MDSEKLKVVAEGMGYKPFEQLSSIYIQRVVFVTPSFHGDNETHEYFEDIEYNPLTNAEQCMEIMERLEKLDLRISVIGDRRKVSVGIYTEFEYLEETGKTINEAVTLAAYEYFKKGEIL